MAASNVVGKNARQRFSALATAVSRTSAVDEPARPARLRDRDLVLRDVGLARRRVRGPVVQRSGRRPDGHEAPQRHVHGAGVVEGLRDEVRLAAVVVGGEAPAGRRAVRRSTRRPAARSPARRARAPPAAPAGVTETSRGRPARPAGCVTPERRAVGPGGGERCRPRGRCARSASVRARASRTSSAGWRRAARGVRRPERRAPARARRPRARLTAAGTATALQRLGRRALAACEPSRHAIRRYVRTFAGTFTCSVTFPRLRFPRASGLSALRTDVRVST